MMNIVFLTLLLAYCIVSARVAPVRETVTSLAAKKRQTGKREKARSMLDHIKKNLGSFQNRLNSLEDESEQLIDTVDVMSEMFDDGNTDNSERHIQQAIRKMQKVSQEKERMSVKMAIANDNLEKQLPEDHSVELKNLEKMSKNAVNVKNIAKMETIIEPNLNRSQSRVIDLEQMTNVSYDQVKYLVASIIDSINARADMMKNMSEKKVKSQQRSPRNGTSADESVHDTESPAINELPGRNDTKDSVKRTLGQKEIEVAVERKPGWNDTEVSVERTPGWKDTELSVKRKPGWKDIEVSIERAPGWKDKEVSVERAPGSNYTGVLVERMLRRNDADVAVERTLWWNDTDHLKKEVIAALTRLEDSSKLHKSMTNLTNSIHSLKTNIESGVAAAEARLRAGWKRPNDFKLLVGDSDTMTIDKTSETDNNAQQIYGNDQQKNDEGKGYDELDYRTDEEKDKKEYETNLDFLLATEPTVDTSRDTIMVAGVEIPSEKEMLLKLLKNPTTETYVQIMEALRGEPLKNDTSKVEEFQALQEDNQQYLEDLFTMRYTYYRAVVYILGFVVALVIVWLFVVTLVALFGMPNGMYPDQTVGNDVYMKVYR